VTARRESEGLGERCEPVKFAGEVSSDSLGKGVGVLRAGCDGSVVIKESAEGWMHEHSGGASGPHRVDGLERWDCPGTASNSLLIHSVQRERNSSVQASSALSSL